MPPPIAKHIAINVRVTSAVPVATAMEIEAAMPTVMFGKRHRAIAVCIAVPWSTPRPTALPAVVAACVAPRRHRRGDECRRGEQLEKSMINAQHIVENNLTQIQMKK